MKKTLALAALVSAAAFAHADVIDRTLELTDEEFNKEAEKLAADYPDLVKIGEIGRSREGRRITLLTITEGSEDKPGYFVQGNIHSKELSATSAGLYVARRLCEDRRSCDILTKVVFYFVPRCNPDGADRMIREPGDERSGWQRFVPEGMTNIYEDCDVNGDGIIQRMRIRVDKDGFRPTERHPTCMVPANRTPDYKGPRYTIVNEGRLRNWDGKTKWRPGFRRWADHLDWNRDWPAGWKRTQWGAGDHPYSVPEVRLQGDWLKAHTNILAALAFHNGYEMLLATGVEHADFKHLDTLGKVGENLVGVPYIATEDVDMIEQGKKQAGRFEEWCYLELGILCFTIELGTRENSAGAKTLDLLKDRDAYTAPYAVCEEQTRNPGLKPAYGDWKKFNHPQFGEVELGGYNGVYFANPHPAHVRRNAEGAYRFLLYHASDILINGTGTACGRK